MKRNILLAGPSASGKTTLSNALSFDGARFVVSTSAYLKGLTGIRRSAELYQAGVKLDRDNPSWLYDLVRRDMPTTSVVVDAIRSFEQHNSFGDDVVRINVVADPEAFPQRHSERGTQPQPTPFMFNRPDFVWNSSRTSVSSAVACINQLAGGGSADIIIGGQFGSEGKGKLAALLAPNYDVLLRSGGPNAGHWVRGDDYEYCFHHLPSGTKANLRATIAIAAGATLYPPSFWKEVQETDCRGRLMVDRNAVLIEDSDRDLERDGAQGAFGSNLVARVGSTAQGVGSAHSRRVMRGLVDPVRTAADDSDFYPVAWDMAKVLDSNLHSGKSVLVEGTQGSGLSLYHGPYPFTTSRDTNVNGLLSESGLNPIHLRHVWMVVRSLPIRVGGNSGPMDSEITWQEVAIRSGRNPTELAGQELTSTTKRQRRVSEFSWSEFTRAVMLNRPTRIFLSFADYITPKAQGVRRFQDLPTEVLQFVDELESRAHVPVAGVSTGRHQDDVCFRKGYL